MAIKKILTDLQLDGKIGMGLTPVNYIDMDVTNVANDSTVGINVDINKENTSGAGFTSNIYGIKAYSKGNSSETIVNIGALWGKAEHIGTGRTYYITGGTNRGYHSGTGDSNAISGTFSEGKVGGTGVGSHEYVVGVNSVAKLDNANADVQFLQGQHCTVQLNAGEVTDNAMCLILDLDHTGGTISGDFEYLRIQNDTLHSSVGGTARAINSLSTHPSEFGGSIESTSFIKTGGTSSQFLKADGSVDSNTYLTSGDVTSSQWDAATGGINYAGGNVGIGATSPSAKLEVSGDLIISSSTTNLMKISNESAEDYFNVSQSTNNKPTLSLGDIDEQYGTLLTVDVENEEIVIHSNGQIYIGDNGFGNSTKFIVDDVDQKFTFTNGDVGIGTTDPQAKLDVGGGIRMGNDTQTPASTNVGTMRYYADAFGSYADMIMQTDTSTYGWVNVVRNTFSV